MNKTPITALLCLSGLMLSSILEAKIDITASQSLVLQESTNRLLAKGDVTVTKKNMQAKADEGEAFFKGKTKKTLSHVHLRHNLTVQTDTLHLKGDQASFHVDQDELIVEGSPLSISGTDLYVEGRGPASYNAKTGVLHTHKGVKAVLNDKKMQADTLTVHMDKGDKNPSPRHVHVEGQVTLSFKDSLVLADYALYDVPQNMIYVLGHVRVTSPPHQMDAPYVIIDRTNGTLSIGDDIPPHILALTPYATMKMDQKPIRGLIRT